MQECLQRSLWYGDQQHLNPLHLLSKARDEMVNCTPEQMERENHCSKNPYMIIETDASNTGWGAFYQGDYTGGPWSRTESQLHINCLELLAATLAVKSFPKEQRGILIHLRMDNTTALNYINKLGGTVSPELNRLTRELYGHGAWREILLEASYLAGTFNVRADEESRVMRDRSDWKLCPIYSN